MTEIERLGLAMGGSADSSFDLRESHSPTPPMHEVLALLQPTATTEAVSNTASDQPPPAPLNPTIIVVNAPPAPAPVPAPVSEFATTFIATPAPVAASKPTKPTTDKPAEKSSTKPTTTKPKSDKSSKPIESAATTTPASKRQKPTDESETATQHVRRIAGSMAPTAPTMSTRSRPAEARTKEATTTSATTKPAADPTVRRPTHPAPVHTPASRPEQTLPEAVRPAAKKPSADPGRVLSPSTLSYQLERHPYESVDQLATRLGSRYGWTEDERRQHRSRLLDIKTAQDLNAVDNKKRAPLCRDQASLDAYFQAVDDRSAYALLDLDELEELYVDH